MNQIRNFMTESTHAIGCDQSLKLAHERMQQLGVHQIAVLEGGVLVGVLSERDIALISAVSPEQLDSIVVEEAMAAEPYAVAPTDDIARVVAYMVEHKHRSAVVMDHNKVLGLFTSMDALRLCSQLLHEASRAGEGKLARGTRAAKE
ncbi:MAG TPA: CBS domain-containing protein [Polyangiales bacterium]|nr:CBS domain-containing protein [Polyangiales bacterium]